MTRHLVTLAAVLVLFVVSGAGAAPCQAPPTDQAPLSPQNPATLPPPAPAIAPPSLAPTFERVAVTAGRSTVLATDFNITRLAVTDPAVADATVVRPREVLIDGKSAGTVSLILWGDGEIRKQYDVVVAPQVSALQQQLKVLFPGEDITLSASGDAVVLAGRVSSTTTMLRAAQIVGASSDKVKVINLLQLPGAQGSQQVMLQVRFAEVNRSAVQELGASFFTGPTGYKNWVGRSTTQQFAAPNFDQLKSTTDASGTSQEGQLTFSDFLNLFVLNTKYNLGALIRALQSKGYFQSLAEPNLIAYNGQKASFLAGGEFPVPIQQGTTNAVTIAWKEFGVRLTFTPVIAGDTIHLTVEPEVSTLDFSNGITLQGFRVPALNTRKASTEVELRDGQSFAIAGLLQNTMQEDTSAVPWLSSIPIVGNFFKSKADRKAQTELMVLITPQLVRPLEPDEVPRLPVNPQRFLPGHGIGSELIGGGGLVDAPPVKKDGATKPVPEIKKK